MLEIFHWVCVHKTVHFPVETKGKPSILWQLKGFLLGLIENVCQWHCKRSWSNLICSLHCHLWMFTEEFYLLWHGEIWWSVLELFFSCKLELERVGLGLAWNLLSTNNKSMWNQKRFFFSIQRSPKKLWKWGILNCMHNNLWWCLVCDTYSGSLKGYRFYLWNWSR